MGKLPVISGKEAIKAFQKNGWRVASVEGSHVTLKKDGMACNLTIPVHGNKDVKRGLLRKLISKAVLTTDEFIELLDRDSI
jgi:predicted RNA binding protein YcfA (HicA-like mRNA interferase family)